MTAVHLPTLLESARDAANEAGILLRDSWQQPKVLTQKGYRDWVTDADFAAQEVITGLLRKRHPEHAFLAEEEANGLRLQGDVRWIIDPIDGTTNFSRQQPNFSISIAAVEGERPLVGVVLDPLRNELFSAVAGDTARLNGKPMQVSSTPQMDNAVVGLDWAHSKQARQATLDSLQRVAQVARTVRSIGSAALALAWVAAGRLDGYWHWQLKAWDLAAGSFIVNQAGGRCTTLEQEPLVVRTGSITCLASNGILHEALQQLAVLPKPPAG